MAFWFLNGFIFVDEFKRDPEKNTNPDLIKGKSDDVKQKIMDGRVKKLEKEIQKFRNVI